ncbi:MAG: acyl-CoA ligase (AMP-forming), exosortase A system-associated [Candidatus Margulisbacteria bacterium]|nr:acyl-CoA ligase (AMP-forming), exosortase A system-associated [Candidatus Margulisiibacteriota bacterium]
MKPYLLQHFLEISAQKYPQKTAVKHQAQSITYSALLKKAQGLGSGLRARGIQRGDRVGIYLDKSIEQVSAIFGALYADAVFVVINTVLHARQVQHILQDCGIKLLLTEEKYLEQLTAVELPKIYGAELQKLSATPPDYTPRNISDDVANIIYTSGSTGAPKGIVLTHRNLIDGARIVSEYLKITAQEKILGLLPFNFDYGLNQLTCTLYKGATIVLFQYFLPNSLLKILAEEEITGLAALPPIWTAVFSGKMADTSQINLPRLRYITNSGGKLPVPLVRKIRAAFPQTELYLMYGLTEAFRSTYLDPAEVDRRPESIGKAIPNVEVEVINADGQPCQPQETGELIHRGACIARGYWNDPQKTAEVYRPNPLLPKENQFLETVVYSGDLAYKDEEGYLYFVGRRDNMIKTAGYRVSPTEVEEVLLQVPGITDAVVFGVEDAGLGYKIRAVLTTDNPALTAAEIREHCQAAAPQYMTPAEIFFAASLPRTASGKIDRQQIIAEYRLK